MKSILNKKTKQNIIDRVQSINGSEHALWGKMNVHQMICHLTDQILVGLGEKSSKDVSNFVLRTIAKNIILMGMSAPKGKVKTVPEMDQNIEGTPPKELSTDKEKLIASIEKLSEKTETAPHPAFGKMNQKQWCKLAYSHLDHHLKQFGK